MDFQPEQSNKTTEKMFFLIKISSPNLTFRLEAIGFNYVCFCFLSKAAEIILGIFHTPCDNFKRRDCFPDVHMQLQNFL